MVEYVDIALVHENENNPRTIKGDRFNKLVERIKQFPEMLEVRPLVVDENNIVQGGNMRLRACRKLGMKEVPVAKPHKWSKEQYEEFMITDNINYGDWDIDELANKYEREYLISLGMLENQLGVIIDEYEQELEKWNDTNAEMPLVPKFSESYESVTIFSNNELDMNWLKNVLEIKSKQDYKNSRVGMCHVITVEEFAELWENRND